MHPYLSPAPPRVLAHRGGVPALPENTLESFRAVLELGVTHLETDVRATSDGIAVLSHDADLRRLTVRPDRIADMTFAELQSVDLVGGASFVSLAAALAAFPRARFNIDVKAAAAALPTAAAVSHAGATERVLIASFSGRRRRAAAALLPGVATSASAGEIAAAVLLTGAGLSVFARRILRDVVAVQVPERMRGLRIVTPRFLRMAHAASTEVHVWTVNDRDSMIRFLELGVDGLVTDRADLAIRLLASRS